MPHDHHHETASHADHSLNRLALAATLHCLTGCGFGEVLGMIISTAGGWGNTASFVLSIVLAFLFGYCFTLLLLVRAGLSFGSALPLAFASDTLSITVMEIVDNIVIFIVPGAISAGLSDTLFWTSLFISLILAALAAFPVNRWLIARGRDHATVHAYFGH